MPTGETRSAARHFAKRCIDVVGLSFVALSFTAIGAEGDGAFLLARTQTSASLTVETGLEYGSGRYGTGARSSYVQAPTQLTWTVDRWSAELTLAYLVLWIPAGDLAIDGSIVAASKPHAASAPRRVSGPGDVVAALMHSWPGAESSDPTYRVRGEVKFGTAAERRGLGTGRNDYSLQIERLQTAGPWSLDVLAEHAWVGRIDALALRDTWSASLDLDYDLTGADSIGVTYSAQSPLARTLHSASDLAAHWQHALGDTAGVRASFSKGLSNASPDYTAALTLILEF